MYNRYMQLHRGGEAPQGEEERRPGPVPRPVPGAGKGPAGHSAGLKDILSGVLGNRVEPGDLLLYLVLLLLYLEQEDEELLIVLAALVVLGFSEEGDHSGSRKS